MTKTEGRQGFWREWMQGLCVLQQLHWQAPWKTRQSC